VNGAAPYWSKRSEAVANASAAISISIIDGTKKAHGSPWVAQFAATLRH